MRTEINEYIVVDTEICHGKPTFKDTRVMVSDVLWMLKEGADIQEILEAYPSITEDHVRAALEFAAKLVEKKFDEVLISI